MKWIIRILSYDHNGDINFLQYCFYIILMGVFIALLRHYVFINNDLGMYLSIFIGGFLMFSFMAIVNMINKKIN
jgi:hypothetical protein